MSAVSFALVVLVVAGCAQLAGSGHIDTGTVVVVALVAIVLGGAVVVWFADPAWTLSGAVALTLFSGHWYEFGLPNAVAPDRFLLALVAIAVVLRAPGSRDRPEFRFGRSHVLIALAVAYVVVSALVAGTLIDDEGTFRLLDRFGLLPFLAFMLAPVVYSTPAKRAVLLGTLVVIGAYLSFTALVQTLGFNGLVWPQYILDPGLITHFGRARGPFVQAAVNGIVMFTCAIACFTAWRTWQRESSRLVALAIGLMCVAGLLFTLQRTVWIGATVASLATLLTVRELRRYLMPAAITAVLLVGVSLVMVPGLAEKVDARRNQAATVQDRENLNAAALNMLAHRPLFGFGWTTFETHNDRYWVLADDRPLNLPRVIPVHNVFISNLAELGLLGTGLWMLALLAGIGAAIIRPGPSSMRVWRVMLGSVALLWLLVAQGSPLSDLCPNLLLWLLAGLVLGTQETDSPRPAATARR